MLAQWTLAGLFAISMTSVQAQVASSASHPDFSKDSLITDEDLGAHARNLRLLLGEHAAPPVLRQFTVGTGGATNNLGRLTEGAQKSPAHSVGIGKTSFSCNDVNR